MLDNCPDCGGAVVRKCRACGEIDPAQGHLEKCTGAPQWKAIVWACGDCPYLGFEAELINKAKVEALQASEIPGRLEEIADILEEAEQFGDVMDEPEGSRFIRLGAKDAERIGAELRVYSKRLKVDP